jgi:hypothetical protein
MIVVVAMRLEAAPPHKRTAGKVGKGFWKVLVTPKAHWVLHSTNADGGISTITVETYDVRKVGSADVARLRWTFRGATDDEARDFSGQEGAFAQVAVTPAGLYLLDKDDDDAKIAKALGGKPSRSDPPKPYAGTTRNHGRYVTIEDGKVCMGTGPEPGAGDCPDTCDGAVCMTTAGIVEIFGTYAPDQDIYRAQ